jgi:serine/threonine protein phosphatase PrpC
MRTHATAQLTGDRSAQCDATAVSTAPSGARAYVLLDGIGSSDDVRDWTRKAARRLARTAAHHADAETGLRVTYNRYAADPDRHGPWAREPEACAVVAVTAPGKPLTIAWCGDTRAYLLIHGTTRRLTADHNLRRVHPPTDVFPYGGNRNIITSCLGNAETDDEVNNRYGHPAIESATLHAENYRLLLASDGAYEPHEDAGHTLSDYLIGDPAQAARDFVKAAVAQARSVPTPHADNATVLIADIRSTA